MHVWPRPPPEDERTDTAYLSPSSEPGASLSAPRSLFSARETSSTQQTLSEVSLAHPPLIMRSALQDLTPMLAPLPDTLEQIDVSKLLIEKYSDTFHFSTSVADVEYAISKGKIASLLGIEGSVAQSPSFTRSQVWADDLRNVLSARPSVLTSSATHSPRSGPTPRSESAVCPIPHSCVFLLTPSII